MNAQLHLCTHTRKHEHTQNTFKNESQRKKTEWHKNGQDADDETDDHPYLFVHFNIEAVGHLIVLRTEKMVEIRTSNTEDSVNELYMSAKEALLEILEPDTYHHF